MIIIVWVLVILATERDSLKESRVQLVLGCDSNIQFSILETRKIADEKHFTIANLGNIETPQFAIWHKSIKEQLSMANRGLPQFAGGVCGACCVIDNIVQRKGLNVSNLYFCFASTEKPTETFKPDGEHIFMYFLVLSSVNPMCRFVTHFGISRTFVTNSSNGISMNSKKPGTSMQLNAFAAQYMQKLGKAYMYTTPLTNMLRMFVKSFPDDGAMDSNMRGIAIGAKVLSEKDDTTLNLIDTNMLDFIHETEWFSIIGAKTGVFLIKLEALSRVA